MEILLRSGASNDPKSSTDLQISIAPPKWYFHFSRQIEAAQTSNLPGYGDLGLRLPLKNKPKYRPRFKARRAVLISNFSCKPAAAPTFHGPVLVITGSKSPNTSYTKSDILRHVIGEDTIYYGEDCLTGATTESPLVIAVLKPSFPAAEAFEAYVQPRMGHVMNMHFNTTGLYRVI